MGLSYYINSYKNLNHVLKICFALLITVALPVSVIFSKKMFSLTSKFFEESENNSTWEWQILRDEARIVPGLGENGTPFKLTEWQEKMAKLDLKKFAVNIYLSDRITYNRTFRDNRHRLCKKVIYDAELPSTSVILPIHNEIYSVVIRMLWSIINSVRRNNPVYKNANFIDSRTGKAMHLGSKEQKSDSELLYLKEIILVDDGSTLKDLKGKLSYYVKTRLPSGLVKIVRLPKRAGLIRAKVEGARVATGDVVVFMDAHCEVQQDWLRPLLQNLKENATYVIFPVIDTINPEDFSYSGDKGSFLIGGFGIHGAFAFLDVPEREKKIKSSDIALTRSPTMAGGIFAMRRSYFFELGAYDEQMLGWGAENLEISFRIWQCGGTLLTAPCSRVAHLFHPHHPFEMPLELDTFGINAARMAEVWMDEYSESFFLYRPHLRNNPKVGNVTERKLLREKLKCKSFRWYLTNVFPEKYIPGADSEGFGRFLSSATGACLHNIQENAISYHLITKVCESELRYSQFLSLTMLGQIRDEYRCLYLQFPRRNSTHLRPCSVKWDVVFGRCRPHAIEQKWNYIRKTQQLQNVHTKLCLEAHRRISLVKADRCDDNMKEQIWFIEYSDVSLSSKYKYTIKPESEAQYQRLTQLAGHGLVHINITKYSQEISKSFGIHRK